MKRLFFIVFMSLCAAMYVIASNISGAVTNVSGTVKASFEHNGCVVYVWDGESESLKVDAVSDFARNYGYDATQKMALYLNSAYVKDVDGSYNYSGYVIDNSGYTYRYKHYAYLQSNRLTENRWNTVYMKVTDANWQTQVTKEAYVLLSFPYQLRCESSNLSMGSVSGGGYYVQNEIATITAHANDGFHFLQWSDGNTENPRVFAVNSDTTYTAEFVANKCLLASGTCGAEGDGSNLTWELSCDSVLTISGTGTMADAQDPSWGENRRFIKTIVIEDGVTSIGSNAFSGCSGLTSVDIPNSVTSIGDDAFSSCTSLTSIVIPNSVTSIGDLAFLNCSGLTSIDISNSLTSIGEFVFYGCSNLVSFIVPNSVTSIEEGAFVNCSSLASITIPNSVTSIGYDAFNGCSGLTSIVIPNSVTNIGNYAFQYCSSLTSITCEATVPPTCGGKSCFGYVDKSIPLYVPCGSVEAYRAAAGWSDFTNIIAIDCPARLEISITAGQWHYIAFPVDVDGADIEYAGNGTWGYYDGARRATGVSGWQSVDPESTSLNANQGYIFYGDQDGTLYVNIDPATLPSGDQSITLTDYPSFHADNENWNFVGNPYNETYNVSHIAPNGMNLYIWNGTGYYYKEAGHDSYDLQPLEAFFVQKKNTENSVNFAAASAGAAAPARAWATNSNRYIDIAAVAGGYTDYTRVVLNETASLDYTVGYDLAKFFSNEAPIQLFTLDVQAIECGVQELPNGVEEIALGYMVLESGEVVISTTDMEETYYLYDAETGITTDLRQSSYTFTAEAGTTVNRLSLRRAPGTATGVDGVNKYVNTITKVIREGHVLIQRGDRIYDLRGQEVK